MKLSDYMKMAGETQASMGRKLGVDRATVNRYVRNNSRPEWPIMDRLVEITQGAVTPDDFMEPPG